ncbi:MAG: TauD/TfdA family dioxygenase [Sphingomonadales bacterium]|nr:TauD/TfdA family dioxygenase [Sphingomonadales bacterium]
MDVIERVGVEHLTTHVGSVVTGLDLAQPLPADTVAMLRNLIATRGVVFFRDQALTDAQYWNFTARFGVPLKAEVTGSRQDSAADLMTASLTRSRHSTAVWHSDTTSLAAPPWATILRAVSPPDVGGDTCWASTTAAWDGLSDPVRRMLEGTHAVHSIRPTYARMLDYAAGFEAQYRPLHPEETVHPVVLLHPETGRRALYVSESFCTRIVELSPPESDAVLPMLFRHIARPEFTVRWKWRANDIAFWDNRSAQHFAVPDYTADRVMQRIVLQGAPPAELPPGPIAEGA